MKVAEWLDLAGLVLGFVGGLLLAHDLLMPWKGGGTERPVTLFEVVDDVCAAVEKAGAARADALARARERAAEAGLAEASMASRSAARQGDLRHSGKVGLVLVVIGFLVQLVAAIVGAGS